MVVFIKCCGRGHLLFSCIILYYSSSTSAYFFFNIIFCNFSEQNIRFWFPPGGTKRNEWGKNRKFTHKQPSGAKPYIGVVTSFKLFPSFMNLPASLAPPRIPFTLVFKNKNVFSFSRTLIKYDNELDCVAHLC